MHWDAPPARLSLEDLKSADTQARALVLAHFDYTAPDNGRAALLAALERVAAPEKFRPKVSMTDAENYSRALEVAERRRKTGKRSTWAVEVVLGAVAIAAFYAYRTVTAAFLVSLLWLVVVGIVRGAAQPPPVPAPSRRPDPRQLAFASAWRARLNSSASSEVDESSQRRVREAQGPRPQSRPRGLTFSEAESCAGEWMAYLGARDVVVSQATRDGGIDAAALGFVAQVKWQGKPVSPAPVHQIFGVSHATPGTKALFFAGPAGYSRDAVAFAERAGVALFEISEDGGAIKAVGNVAAQALGHGLSSLW